MRRLVLLGCSTVVLGLTACGGGGDGDSGNSGSSTSNFPPQTPLTYAGATTGAAVTAGTASLVTANVISASTAGGSSSLLTGVSVQADAAVQPAGATGMMRRLAHALRSDALARPNGGAL